MNPDIVTLVLTSQYNILYAGVSALTDWVPTQVEIRLLI